jgi:DNA-binding response OmpR family regulator
VLIVEPEEDVRELSARDPDEAVTVSQRHEGPIALIIADLLAPGVAGDGLVRRLGPRRSGAGVLYLSGDLEDSLEHRGLRRGVGFLRKLFTVDARIHKIHQMPVS